MTFLRSPLLWSIALHGGAIGTVMAVALGTTASPRPILQIAVLPAETSVAIATSAPPVEVVELERERDEIEPPPIAEAVEEFFAEPLEAPLDWRPTATAEAQAADWLVTVPKQLLAAAAQVVTEQPAPEVTPAQISEQARVVEVIPGLDTKPDYPAQARRLGWQGITEVAVEVGADGTVLTTTIAKSSGYPVLDRAALRAVRTWRFRGGAGRTKVTVEFRLTA